MTIKPEHYIISDLHLGHANILKYCRQEFETIQQHDDTIIQNISKLGINDFLWVLGDVAFKKESLFRLKETRCHLGLVMGNHDWFKAHEYKEVFSRIKGVEEMTYQDKSFVFTHIPIHKDALRWDYNIHGHMHTEMIWDSGYINVCCEKLNYMPVQISELLNQRGVF